VTLLIRNTLNDLERSIEATNYKITVKSKANGNTVVTLFRDIPNGGTRTFEGEASGRNSFPYADALKIANARMRQFEDRFER
jgi:hypothetical protein